jgi:hypothetical protein
VQALPPPQHLSPLRSSPLVLSWRLAFSRPSHSPSALMGPPVHGPSKRLQGRVCLGAWRAREGGSGAGPRLGFAQLGFAQEGGRGERRCVWGADWAAVVSPSPRDEASAKQVLPWRDRHGRLNGCACSRQPWAPLCVSGWSHGCAVQPLQRPVPVASAHYRPATPYMSMLLTDLPNSMYTRERISRDASSRPMVTCIREGQW